MFTLSEKIRVLNTPGHVRVYEAATNTEVTTTADIADGLTGLDPDVLFVEGYGRFNINQITNIKCRRAVPATQFNQTYTVVAPNGIAVGDAIEVIVSLNTSRYQAEVLIQNEIGAGRTFKFATKPLTAITAAAIRTAIVDGYTEYLAHFNIGTALVEVINGVAADAIIVKGDLAGSVSVDRVEIRRVQQGIATQMPVALATAVVGTNSPAFEGYGLGKFLEESIRMSTPINSDPYAVDAADTRVDLRGAYTEISFDYATSYSENLGTTAADFGHTAIGGPAMGGVAATHSFVLFLNEGTCLAANSAIEKIAAIAVLRTASLAYLTATTTAAPLTAAQERSEVLIYKDNSSKATPALFIV